MDGKDNWMEIMENKFLPPFHYILASNSPRRKELLQGLGIDFEVRVKPNINEDYPSGLSVEQIPQFIAVEKAAAYKEVIRENELVITADTVVVVDNQILGKPTDAVDAYRMLNMLRGRTHQVITGVCLTTKLQQCQFTVTTDVSFKQLSDDEIAFYVDTFKPFDKAGAYGIQEWIGFIGVKEIKGSYLNVMGLPVQRIYDELQKW